MRIGRGGGRGRGKSDCGDHRRQSETKYNFSWDGERRGQEERRRQLVEAQKSFGKIRRNEADGRRSGDRSTGGAAFLSALRPLHSSREVDATLLARRGRLNRRRKFSRAKKTVCLRVCVCGRGRVRIVCAVWTRAPGSATKGVSESPVD